MSPALGVVGQGRLNIKGKFPPKKIWAERQFRSKKVRAFSNKEHQIGLPNFLEAKAIVCSPRLRARRANLCFPPQKITKSSLVRGRGLEPPRACAHHPLKVACLPISPPAPIYPSGTTSSLFNFALLPLAFLK